MLIPFEPKIFDYTINIHLVLEYAAFFAAFRYYVFLRKRINDHISEGNRLSIIIGAVFGAFIGSRFLAYLECPSSIGSPSDFIQILNNKTIMGGLFGGLLGVELAKKIINEKQASGDLFTFPLILGIFIGRIGCFLSGTKEFTYGKTTNFFMGMDLGDGLNRHPVALYELIFLLILYFFLKKIQRSNRLESGGLFKYFMLAYFGFRFFIEFLKPNIFYFSKLSSIQWLCILCWMYYLNELKKIRKYAR